MVQLSHPYMTTRKTMALTRWIFVSKIKSLLFNMLSSLVITFLPKHKCLNFMAAVTICSDFGAQGNKVCHCFHCFPIYLPWSDGTRHHGLSFLNVELVLSQLIRSPLSLSSKGSLAPLHFLSLKWHHLHIWGCWYFSQQSWFQVVLHPAWHFVWYTLHIIYIIRVTIYNLDIILFQSGTSPLFHVQF